MEVWWIRPSGLADAITSSPAGLGDGGGRGEVGMVGSVEDLTMTGRRGGGSTSFKMSWLSDFRPTVRVGCPDGVGTDVSFGLIGDSGIIVLSGTTALGNRGLSIFAVAAGGGALGDRGLSTLGFAWRSDRLGEDCEMEGTDLRLGEASFAPGMDGRGRSIDFRLGEDPLAPGMDGLGRSIDLGLGEDSRALGREGRGRSVRS